MSEIMKIDAEYSDWINELSELNKSWSCRVGGEFMDTIIEIVGEFFEFIIEFIEIKLYKRKNRDEDNDSNF